MIEIFCKHCQSYLDLGEIRIVDDQWQEKRVIRCSRKDGADLKEQPITILDHHEAKFSLKGPGPTTFSFWQAFDNKKGKIFTEFSHYAWQEKAGRLHRLIGPAAITTFLNSPTREEWYVNGHALRHLSKYLLDFDSKFDAIIAYLHIYPEEAERVIQIASRNKWIPKNKQDTIYLATGLLRA